MMCSTKRSRRSASVAASRNSATGWKAIRLSEKSSLSINRPSAARRVRIPRPTSKPLTQFAKFLPTRPMQNAAVTLPAIFLSTCREAAAKLARATAPSRTMCSFSPTSNSSAKLAAHLSRTDNAGILYILDEPTTGLHFDDIAKLLSAFRKLLEGGASLLVIEHNLDVIKSADWLIDLGPEGGDQGGKIIATGTPEQVARNTQSHTGHFLSRVLNGNGQAKRPANGASKPAGPSATISNGAKTPPAEP